MPMREREREKERARERAWSWKGEKERLREGALGLAEEDDDDHGYWEGELPTRKRRIERGGEDEGKWWAFAHVESTYVGLSSLYLFIFKSKGKIAILSLI